MTDEDQEFISKTQLKREAEALQKLGTELVEMPPQQRARIPLPEELIEAIELARRIHSRGGRRRQLQYIGKLMRRIDAAPIRDALEAMHLERRQSARRFHQLEQWRERLIEEGDSALAEVLSAFPNADRQHLRQLVRNGIKEKNTGRPAGAGRALFRYLKELQGDGEH